MNLQEVIEEIQYRKSETNKKMWSPMVAVVA
jgi:hypothetical protein